MAFTCVVMIAYVVVIKPQKERIMVILTAAGEALLLVFHLLSTIFLDENIPEEDSFKYGMIMIILLGLYILVNWVVVGVITFKDLKGKWRLRKEKKVADELKKKEDYEYKKWRKRRQVIRKQQ